MNNYSAIVPVYNEIKTVTDVLSALKAVPEISEIICVDDGSTDGSCELVKDNFPEIILIRHEKNQGKAEAVLSGLMAAQNNFILLIDSDLIGLKTKEISGAIKLFKENKRVARMDISAVNILKILKRGLVSGVILDFKIWREIISYAGWRMFIKQTFLFARDKVYL